MTISYGWQWNIVQKAFLYYGKCLKQECTATTSSTTITTAMNVRDGPSSMRLVIFISDTISQIVRLREMNRNRRLTSLPNTVLPRHRLSTLRNVVHRGKLQQRFLFPNRLRFTSSYTFRNGLTTVRQIMKNTNSKCYRNLELRLKTE